MSKGQLGSISMLTRTGSVTVGHGLCLRPAGPTRTAGFHKDESQPSLVIAGVGPTSECRGPRAPS